MRLSGRSPPGCLERSSSAAPGLARGYLGQPDLTAERFVPDPFAPNPGERLYRTGDLARRLADGAPGSFLGRIDQQVKVNGQRIEPGEIEAALRRHPEVRDAVVLARADSAGGRRLVAYLVPAGAAAPGAAAETPYRLAAQAAGRLRAFLGQTLPASMVPWAYVALPALPLTVQGKLDRAALPPLPAGADEAGAAYVAPRSDLERAIEAVWRRVLGAPRIGVEESFFAAGGNSLQLARLQSLLAEALGREVALLDLFRHPTVASQARHLETSAAPPRSAVERQAGERAVHRRDSIAGLRQRRSRPAGGNRPAPAAAGGDSPGDHAEAQQEVAAGSHREGSGR